MTPTLRDACLRDIAESRIIANDLMDRAKPGTPLSEIQRGIAERLLKQAREVEQDLAREGVTV